MTVSRHTYAAVLTGSPDQALAIKGGRITDDDAAIPKVQASLRIGVPSAAVLAALDSRTLKRVKVTCGATFPGGGTAQSRVFDLALRDRDVVVDTQSGEVTLTIASDEAVLGDYAQLADDNTPRQYESSLRAVIGYVLGKIGATLAASPSGDANVTRYWAVTNLLLNPSCEGSITPWSAAGNCSLFLATAPRTGTNSCGFQSTAAGDLAVTPMALSGKLGVTAGRAYTFDGYGKMNGATARSIAAVIRWVNADGASPWPDVVGTALAMNTSTFVRPSIIATAPAGAVAAFPYFRVTGSTAASQIGYIDDAMFHEGDEVVPYFDPVTVPAGYTAAWAQAAYASTSTRTPVTPRDKAVMTWRAGQSGMDFLLSLVQSAGFRLVCDEARVWTLRPASYSASGAFSVRTGINLIRQRDSIRRNSGLWFDGAVFVYEWLDPVTGQRMMQTDGYATTGSPQIVKRFDVSTPYPGPGRAQNAVQRAASRGRELNLTVVSDWNTSAEQGISAYLDSTPIQTGKIATVEWNLDSDEMELTTRSTDTPAGAIDLRVGTIDAQTGYIG